MFGLGKSVYKLRYSAQNGTARYRLPSAKSADTAASVSAAALGCFLRGDIVSDNGCFFQIGLAGLQPAAGRMFRVFEVKLLTESLAAAIDRLRSSGLFTENLVLLPDRIYFAGSGCLFTYIPIKRKKEQKTAKLGASIQRLLNLLSGQNALFAEFARAYKLNLDPVTQLIGFAGSVRLPQAPRPTAPPTAPQADSEGETTLFGMTAEQDDSEGETTLFGMTSQQDDSEGETTLFGMTSQQDDSEGETTLFGMTSQQGNPEGETTLFIDNSDQEFSPGSFPVNAVNREAEESEGETTLFTGSANGEPAVTLIRALNGEELALPGGGAVLGSFQGACQVVIPNRSVSRRHAEITVENGSVFIKDLISTNGTIVDGVRLKTDEKAEIFDGSFISLGNEALQVRIR